MSRGLLERVGAPADKTAFLTFDKWLTVESAGALANAADRLRREGAAFQLALATPGSALIEASGRTSGRRAVVRLRELTGERRSFTELKEQAGFVIAELQALKILADMLPLPLWRRSRTGRLVWVNAAYARAVEAENAEAVLASGIELLPARTRDAVRDATRLGLSFDDTASAIVAGRRRQVRVLDQPAEDGTVGGAVDVSEIEALRLQVQQLTDSNVPPSTSSRGGRGVRQGWAHPVSQHRVPRDLGSLRRMARLAPGGKRHPRPAPQRA
jgi:PAS domain-containing protein